MGVESEIHAAQAQNYQHDSDPTPAFEFQIPIQGTQPVPLVQNQAPLPSQSLQGYPAQQFPPQVNTQDSDSDSMDETPARQEKLNQPPARPVPGYADQQPPTNFPRPQATPQLFQPQAIPQQFPPQANPQQFPPQASLQQFPPQAGYYSSTQPMQPVPQAFQPQMQQTGAPVYGMNTGTMLWKTNLFDCMDDPNNAIITFCFPFVTFGQIAEIVDHGQTTCATSGFLYGCISAFIGVPCLISCGYRSKLRSKFDLVEVPAADWITHCFCEYCALCQEYRELKIRGLDPAIGWQGNLMRAQNMQQQQQSGIMMPPVQYVMK